MPKFLDNIEFWTQGYGKEKIQIDSKTITLNKGTDRETTFVVPGTTNIELPQENPEKKLITDISRDIIKEKEIGIYQITKLTESGMNVIIDKIDEGLKDLDVRGIINQIDALQQKDTEHDSEIDALQQYNNNFNLKNGTGTDSIVQKYSGQIDETHFGNVSEGESGAVFGEANSNSGNRAIVSGKMNRNSAPNSLIIGLGNGRGIGVNPTIDALSGEQLFVFGTDNSVSNGDGNAVLGNENTLSDVRYTTIIGRGNIINNTSLYEGKCVVGRYNNQKRDTMFEVGVGDYNNRVNGLEVYKDGRVKVHGEPTESNDVIRLNEFSALTQSQVDSLF